MFKSIKSLLFVLIAAIVLCSCGAREKVVYLQGSENMGEVVNPYSYSARIKKDDQLNIIVNCKVPELAQPFNMTLNNRAFSGASTTSLATTSGSPQIFWVDPNGDINYPTIGKLHVEGMTRSELSAHLEQYLKDNGYINDPIVNVTFYNYKISVLGEVARPGQFTLTNDRVTILDAIAMAGDLTIYGERDKVKVIREDNGQQKTFVVDLRDADLLKSECYYLHQNDLVYVEPNKTKASNREVSTLYTFGISLTSLALTIATFIKAF